MKTDLHRFQLNEPRGDNSAEAGKPLKDFKLIWKAWMINLRTKENTVEALKPHSGTKLN